MPDNRLKTAAQWLLIGLLLGYALRSMQRTAATAAAPNPHLRNLNRQWVRATYQDAVNRAMAETEAEADASDEG